MSDFQEDREEVATIEAAIDRLCSGDDLSEGEAETVFAQVVAGTVDDARLSGLLVALKAKGEAASEMIGAVRALRAAATPFPRPEGLFADTCGTGGDGAGTINISTAVAFAAAACGLPVVKHGNRSITSRCGSADVLEKLGAKLDLQPEQSRAVLDASGVCFLFAPHYHPGMRHAAAARKALGVRTIFNMLGPCLNPAVPPVQIVGVAEPRLIAKIGEVLASLGCERALIVHGDGLDEVALHAETEAMRLVDGSLDWVTLTPEEAGLSRAPIEHLAGGDADENARRLQALLGGAGSAAERNMVAINAGALLVTARLADGLREGTAMALDALAGGKAGKRLAAFIEASRG